MTNSTINVLMTGGGAPGAAGILKCLSREPAIKVVVGDANPNAVGRYLAEDFEIIRHADDPAFIPSLLELCRRKDIHIVMPLVTRELIPLARSIGEFELAGAKPLVSPAESLEIANDKSRLYQFLQWRGMSLPEFRVVQTLEQFETAAGELGYPAKPICFKPSVSNGSRGFRVIDASNDGWHQLFNEKPTPAFLTYQEALRVLASRQFPELLVSEFLPGLEYSVDCLANRGEPVIVVPRSRKKMVNGISVEGEFVRDQSIISYCSQLIRELRLHGNIGIQVRQAVNGDFLLLEVNPRVQGTISAGLGAGINLPVLAIRQELQLPITPQDLEVKWGTRFSRHWSEVFY